MEHINCCNLDIVQSLLFSVQRSNPDVMLEAYFEHPYSPLFFVVYLAITFYYLMNVVSYGNPSLKKKKNSKLVNQKLSLRLTVNTTCMHV